MLGVFWLTTGTAADAAPRRVAVVNAAADQPAGARLAEDLRAALAVNPDLEPVAVGDLSRALEGELPEIPGHDLQLARAQEALAGAEKSFDRFDYDAALGALAVAEQQLLQLEPEPATAAGLAEVSFLGALIHLGNGNQPQALRAFRSVRRLDPSRTELDPARFPPAIVQLFARSDEPVPASARLQVSAPYDGAAVFVDGVKVGVTPLETHVSPGIHYVQAVYPEHRVFGERIDIGTSAQVKVRLERLPVDERARQARRRALGDGDYLATAVLAANLTNAEAVVLVRGAGSSLQTALFDGRTGRLSSWRNAAGVEPAKLVAPLVPPEPPAVVVAPDPGGSTAPIEPRPWYRNTWTQVAIGGAVVTVIGVLAFALSGDEGTRTLGSPGDDLFGPGGNAP